MTPKRSIILLAGAFLRLAVIEGKRSISDVILASGGSPEHLGVDVHVEEQLKSTTTPTALQHLRVSLNDGVNKVANSIGVDPPIFLAITLTIFASSVSSLGLALQKLSHASSSTFNGLYFLRLRWAFGFVVYIVGHFIGLFALRMGPQSILSCFNFWTMIMTFAWGVLMLGEKVRCHRVLSSLICIAGSVMVVCAHPASAEVPTAAEWFWRLGSADFLAFFAAILLLACIVAMHISVALRWALLAAVLSWLSVIGAKVIAGIALEIDITAWQSWVLLGMTVAVAFSNVHFLNMALQCGEITLVIPFYEMIALQGQASVGGVFFREFNSFHTILQVASFCMGLLLISGGLSSMVGHENKQILQEGELQVEDSQKGKSETYRQL